MCDIRMNGEPRLPHSVAFQHLSRTRLFPFHRYHPEKGTEPNPTSSPVRPPPWLVPHVSNLPTWHLPPGLPPDRQAPAVSEIGLSLSAERRLMVWTFLG